MITGEVFNLISEKMKIIEVPIPILRINLQ